MLSLFEAKTLYGFFENELTNKLLYFWLPRCEDREHGGYFNCFTNQGDCLMSRDKYTWSQGRFVWMFAKLAMLDADIFSAAQRKEFLRLAAGGADFLMKHCLIAPGDWRCVFLMDEEGTPKKVGTYDELDMSISADCFVVAGLARYALVSGEQEPYCFAKKLFESVCDRYKRGNYRSLPYPLSKQYISHAQNMILTNVSAEMARAAARLSPQDEALYLKSMEANTNATFSSFVDEQHLLHEFKYADGDFPQNLFGQHINPGHTLEDMWFQLESMDIRSDTRYEAEAAEVALATLQLGWDKEKGGLFHYVACNGSLMQGDPGDAAEEPQMKLALDDWGSKLWWVHSEALYTTLLFYIRTNDDRFWKWFQLVFQYVYTTFPVEDPEIREWAQIRTRDGKPQDKVVALPVKDPYHIIRNVSLILELLNRVIISKTKEEKPVV